MNCPKCNKDIPNDALLCCYCGKKLASSRKNKRTCNGSGCAYRRGAGWVAQVIIGYRDLAAFDINNPDNPKGRVPIKRVKCGFKTKADALAYIPTLKAGGMLKPETAPALEYYWKNYEKNEFVQLSDSKQTAYSIAWNKLKDLHSVQIDQLTVADLRDAVAKACKT